MINGSHIQNIVLPYFKQRSKDGYIMFPNKNSTDFKVTYGTFLEIGCWQGTHYSQSKELEDAGWSGICVDPFPFLFENRKATLISKAVSKDGKPREFVKVFRDRRCGGDVSYFSGFKDSIAFHWPLIEKHCDYIIGNVETIRFGDIGTPLHTNFLSVDTEGSELEIISSIDFSRYSFDMIMFEHNGVDVGVAALLESKGYKLFKRLEIDDIFVRV